MRMLFNSGPAVYTDDIATRDVHNLRQVQNQTNDFHFFSSFQFNQREITKQEEIDDMWISQKLLLILYEARQHAIRNL